MSTAPPNKAVIPLLIIGLNHNYVFFHLLTKLTTPYISTRPKIIKTNIFIIIIIINFKAKTSPLSRPEIYFFKPYIISNIWYYDLMQSSTNFQTPPNAADFLDIVIRFSTNRKYVFFCIYKVRLSPDNHNPNPLH